MDISIFEAAGPIMVGPSSSHTAGPARLARVALSILGKSAFSHVTFGLHGSLAKTGKGHGTYEALIAGILGLTEDDERIPQAFQLAKEVNLSYEFYETVLDGYHENSAVITFTKETGKELPIIGSSIGGGQILIRKIGDFDVELAARAPSTLVCRWYDVKGVLSRVTRVLANREINIAVLRLSRESRGGMGCCVLETDTPVTQEMVDEILFVSGVVSVILIEGA
jgi:L-serine dehydratase